MARLTRRRFIASTAAAGCVGRGEIGVGPTGIARPNIVYLYSDQHRAPWLGCYGDPDAQTPCLDALAAESVLFEAAFTNASLCRPARATMMTGVLPHLHGCWNNNQLADRHGESHVRRIRDAGWHTALIGKAHLDWAVGHANGEANVAQLLEWGFEHALEVLSQPTTVERPNDYMDWLVQTTPAGEAPTKAGRYAEYVLAWEHLDSPPPDDDPTRLSTDDHFDVWTGRRAVDWLIERTDPTPFYLQVNLPGPHSPFDAPREFRERYDVDALRTPILGRPTRMGSLLQFLRDTKPELHGLSAVDGRFLRMTYLSKITLVDQVLGEVLAALEATGRLADTWVIYGSDHGELAGDHELWGKVAMYDGSLRIPLIVRPPGGVAPRRSTAMVDQRDVTATILDLAGLAPPAGGGTSLREHILDGEAAGRDHVVALVEGRPLGGLRTAMVRTTDHKLVVDLETGVSEELYALATDPDERDNRIDDPDLVAVASDLADRLDAELQS